MAYHHITSSQILATGTVRTLDNQDDAFINAGVVLSSADAFGISAGGTDHDIINFGNIYGKSFTGVALGGDMTAAANNTLFNGAGGALAGGFSGAAIFGRASSVENEGLISGEVAGVYFGGIGTGSVSSIENSGSIFGGTYGIGRQSDTNTETLEIINSGLVRGQVWAYWANGAVAVEKITNTGRMVGIVELGGGNDLYDGRGGRVKGEVMGGDGADALLGGLHVERLTGGAGLDILAGGGGSDLLGGGEGADRFRFGSLAECGDRISDFDASDFLEFRGASFGGLSKGRLALAAYHESNAGVAHDTSDRFIYELDTGKLWFDKDGTGAAAALLVATLDNKFNMSAADILII